MHGVKTPPKVPNPGLGCVLSRLDFATVVSIAFADFAKLRSFRIDFVSVMPTVTHPERSEVLAGVNIDGLPHGREANRRSSDAQNAAIFQDFRGGEATGFADKIPLKRLARGDKPWTIESVLG